MKSIELNNIQYDVEKVIGKGSFSVVYRATNTHNNITCAIKKIRIKKAKYLIYIENEYNILLESQYNENIIKIYDYAKCCTNMYGHVPIRYFIMECGDDTLRNALLSSVSVDETKKIFLQCANALKYIHSIGVVHADIKLDNYIMVGKVVKLVDFGLAFRLGEDTQKLNKIGGTLKYMSPEAYCIHHGYEMVINKTIDIWSLGVIIYEFITKRCLISTKFIKCKKPQKIKIIQYYSSLEFNLCNDYADIISVCLCIDPKKRFTSAQLCELF